RRHHRSGRLRRRRPQLSNLGARPLPAASRRDARARAPARFHAAAAEFGDVMRPGAHIPVLLAEVIAALKPHDDGVYVDGTFGGGGYSEAMLRSAGCRVVALDRDPAAMARGEDLAKLYAGRLTLIEGRFSEMERLLAPLGLTQVSGVALDLGISSTQIDDPARGFSFRVDGPLDMRMGRDGRSAADLVNTGDEAGLAMI